MRVFDRYGPWAARNDVIRAGNATLLPVRAFGMNSGGYQLRPEHSSEDILVRHAFVGSWKNHNIPTATTLAPTAPPTARAAAAAVAGAEAAEDGAAVKEVAEVEEAAAQKDDITPAASVKAHSSRKRMATKAKAKATTKKPAAAHHVNTNKHLAATHHAADVADRDVANWEPHAVPKPRAATVKHAVTAKRTKLHHRD